MIIDSSYVATNALNIDLISLANNNQSTTNKIINFVEQKIFLTVCRDEFKDPGSNPTTYTFPDDLKQATLHLVESYFLDYGESGKKAKKLHSVKFDDWSETYAEEKNESFIPLSFYGIPILQSYYEIIQKYQCTDNNIERGMFTTPDC